MKKKIFVISSITVIALVIIYFLFFNNSSAESNAFTFAKITRGNLSTTNTSTGTLQAVLTVDVGTQVSGKIDKIFVDYNYNVKKGQLLAILDTTNLALQVKNAVAGMQKAQAQYELSRTQYELDKSLYEKKFMSELDFVTSKSNYEISAANVISAKSALAQAKTNLGYAFIYSPIGGKIINKNVEEGQTVAASLSAPTLFTIAEDLSKMEILASVDESDIGQIKVGQKATFTVEAYPDRQYEGKVVQIRLGSTVVSNVVNYTVVVNAENDDKSLLPGMTATIEFYLDTKTNVLIIPNAALRFQPTEQMKTDFTARMEKENKNLPDSLKQRFQSFGRNQGMQNNGGGFGNPNNKTRGSFWYVDEKGNPSMGFAILGLTDGKNTEVVRSRVLKENMKVITGFETTSNTNSQNSNQGLQRSMGRGF
jgi:HlyD family secretion protein